VALLAKASGHYSNTRLRLGRRNAVGHSLVRGLLRREKIGGDVEHRTPQPPEIAGMDVVAVDRKGNPLAHVVVEDVAGLHDGDAKLEDAGDLAIGNWVNIDTSLPFGLPQVTGGIGEFGREGRFRSPDRLAARHGLAVKGEGDGLRDQNVTELLARLGVLVGGGPHSAFDDGALVRTFERARALVAGDVKDETATGAGDHHFLAPGNDPLLTETESAALGRIIFFLDGAKTV